MSYLCFLLFTCTSYVLSTVDVHILHYADTRNYNFSYKVWCPLNSKDSTCAYYQEPQENYNLPKERRQNDIYVSMPGIFQKNYKGKICGHNPNLTLIETMEPMSNIIRFNKLAEHFDGNATTQPGSTITRNYYAPLREKEFVVPFRNFSELIKGASYVASACGAFKGHIERNNIIKKLRNLGIRIDGLGKCMHTPVGPEGVQLGPNHTSENKVEVISRYLFNLAFENTIEEGYVTEKPGEALRAGTVPIYYGDSKTLKSLIPDPNGAIYLSDFRHNISKLASYLNFLANNETAYEVHRAWRRNYSYEAQVKRNRKFQTFFECEVCEWAIKAVNNPRKSCLRDYTDVHINDLLKPINASHIEQESLV